MPLSQSALTICTAINAAGFAEQEHAPQDVGDLSQPLQLTAPDSPSAAVAASSAMLLPGVSGSFLLLLLGIYHEVLGSSSIPLRDYLLLVDLHSELCRSGSSLFARLD